MNDCPNGSVRDVLPEFLHDRLGASERAGVQAHLDACDDCQQELALLRDLRGVMRAAPAVNVAAITAHVKPYRAPVRRSWVGWRAAAAVTLLVAGGSSVVLVQRGAGSRPVSEGASVVPAAPQQTSGTVQQTTLPAAAQVADVPSKRGELAVGGGTITELSDAELASLVKDIDTLDAMPSTDVESGSLAPMGPTSGRKGEL